MYHAVIEKERRGEYRQDGAGDPAYHGRNQAAYPHVDGGTPKTMRNVALIEVGGTVGDIESLPFLEAIRQFNLDVYPTPCCNVHVTLVPFIEAAGELKPNRRGAA